MIQGAFSFGGRGRSPFREQGNTQTLVIALVSGQCSLAQQKSSLWKHVKRNEPQALSLQWWQTGMCLSLVRGGSSVSNVWWLLFLLAQNANTHTDGRKHTGIRKATHTYTHRWMSPACLWTVCVHITTALRLSQLWREVARHPPVCPLSLPYSILVYLLSFQV